MKCGIALPNVQSSSDHIMLLCDIQLGGGTGQQSQPPASPIFQGQQQKVCFSGRWCVAERNYPLSP